MAERVYGKAVKKNLKRKRTFVPGAAAGDAQNTEKLSDEQKKLIVQAIKKTTNMEEIDRLEQILASGKIPRDMVGLLSKVSAMDTD